MNNQIFCIGLLAGIPFLLSYSGDFVFDDTEAILKNKDVTQNSWSHSFYNDFWGTNITSDQSHKSYRPLTILSFKLNYALNGNKLSPEQFKITNIFLHVLCCVLLWRTYIIILSAEKFTKMNETAFKATILFCTHPIHVEAVSGIVGRADVLSAIAYFSAFILYTKAMKETKLLYLYLFMSILLAGIAMLFKENGITVLGYCLLYEVIKNVKRRCKHKKQTGLNIMGFGLPFKSITRIVCLIISASIFIYLRWLVMGGMKPTFKSTDNPAAFANNIITKAATINYIYFMNIVLLIWPHWLCYDWSMGCIPLVEGISDLRLLWIIALYLLGCFTLLFMFFARHTVHSKRIIIISFGLLVIPFLPAANIFYPVGFVIAERILFIPSAGYCLLVAVGFDKIKNIIKNKITHYLYYFLILLYFLRTAQRSFEWQTEYKLFTSGLLVCPLNAKVHYNVAKVADRIGNVSWAANEYREAIRLYPEYYQAMNNYANVLKKETRFSEAEYYLKKAISLKQDFPAAWMNLGIVLASTKRFEESEKAYKNALKFRKIYPDCYYNLGNLYLEMNATNLAIDNLLNAIQMNPQHNSAWTNLLAVLDNTGQIERALQIIPDAIKFLPDSPSVVFAIANIYGKIDKYIEAEEFFLKAIKLFGENIKPIHYANLGVLYHRWKKYDLARKMYRKALDIEPGFKSARTNLDTLEKLRKNKNL